MAKKTPSKKRKPAVKARRVPKPPKQRRLVDIKILTDNVKIQELLKTPEFKTKFDLAKSQIIERYNLIKSPPFCKILKCDKTGLVILLQVYPSKRNAIHNNFCAVTITTMLGRVLYDEQAEFKNLRRACEYVSDFNQEQAARFTQSAINAHAKDMINYVATELSPIMDRIMKPNPDQKKAVSLPYKAEPIEIRK